MKIILITLLLFFICSCSGLQYNYTPTSFNYNAIRYGIKEQSIIIVLPIIQDNKKLIGNRTIMDIRVDIISGNIITGNNKKYVKYNIPNGFMLGLKYKF